ncbi:MAG: chromate resistance protein [Candidatus Magnetoovum sp. WYHC-5]|nr:chromate resistance protein [Candidatus Magnetoovum sp. WYHC-5]
MYNTWIVFTYSLPTQSSKARVRVWRKLSNIGALQLKNSLYILPMSDIHYEHLEWTVKEVEEMGGEAVFFKCEHIENITNDEIVAMFNKERESGYIKLEEKLKDFDAMLYVNDVVTEDVEAQRARLMKRFMREFNSIKEIDFFSSEKGERMAALLESLSNRLNPNKELVLSAALNIEDFTHKIWVTRKNPYIDRIASWWYIKRFIDDKAQIHFVLPSEGKERPDNAILFDIDGGDFTHKDNMVTFEVLAGSFKIIDKGINYIMKVVHSIDLEDDTSYLEDTKGIKKIIQGIVKMSKDDHEVMDRGMIIFDALYANQK